MAQSFLASRRNTKTSRQISLDAAGLSPLPRKFYTRDTHLVANELLGKVLVRKWRGGVISGRIVEVESYVGEDDAACHASRGRTPRTDVLYSAPGTAYVYLIYGMYSLLNAVTEQQDFPAAVLIRALEPLDGIAAMQRARPGVAISKLASGPGKLTRALRIGQELNRVDLTRGDRLFIADDGHVLPRGAIVATPRIGVDYAGPCALKPWRYIVRGSASLSRTYREP